jgi:transcriptional regulator with XRE-family HTH domain
VAIAVAATIHVGGRIRSLRRARGITQTALAFPGCTSSHLSRIESGAKPVTPKVLAGIADRLGITVDELVRGDSGPRPRLTDAALRERHHAAVMLLGHDETRGWSIEERLDLLAAVVWPGFYADEPAKAA